MNTGGARGDFVENCSSRTLCDINRKLIIPNRIRKAKAKITKAIASVCNFENSEIIRNSAFV